MTTGYVYDPIFLKHTLKGHPENAQRLAAIMAGLEEHDLLEVLHKIPSRAATKDEIKLVHRDLYIKQIKEISRFNGRYFDADTYTNRYTYSAAAVAAGSLIDLTLAVLEGEVANGFALVRPPGHHATYETAKGFCIFNNIALATQIACQQPGIERIAIVDFDVHHGNGTQDFSEEAPHILFISSHQYPLFPGTGGLQEIGRGEGRGTVVNLPLPAGVGDVGFRTLYTDVVIPMLQRFQPHLMLVSAGYDAHWRDPLAGLSLSLMGFAWIGQALVSVAEALCEGRIIFTLEGGYDLDVLSLGVVNTVKALLGRDDFVDPIGHSPWDEPDITERLAVIKDLHNMLSSDSAPSSGSMAT
jgi:acetoin utilization deacetylase AcuC-like enzyme